MKHLSSMRLQRGSALLEMALSIMVFLGLFFAVMDFGRAVSAYNILAGATKEGARYAIVHGSASGTPASSDDIQNVVRQWAVSLDPNSVVVTATWSPNNAPQGTVTVRSQYTFTPLTGMVIGSNLTLGSYSQMVISQ